MRKGEEKLLRVLRKEAQGGMGVIGEKQPVLNYVGG